MTGSPERRQKPPAPKNQFPEPIQADRLRHCQSTQNFYLRKPEIVYSARILLRSEGRYGQSSRNVKQVAVDAGGSARRAMTPADGQVVWVRLDGASYQWR